MSFELSSCFPVKSHFASKHHASNESIEDTDDHGFISTWEATKKCSTVNGARPQQRPNGHVTSAATPQNGLHNPRNAPSGKWYEPPPHIHQNGNGHLNGLSSSYRAEDPKDDQPNNEFRPEQKAQHYAGTPQRSFSPNKLAQTGVLQKLHHINRSQNGVLRRKRDQSSKKMPPHNGNDSLNHDSTYDNSSGQFSSSIIESDSNNPSAGHNYSFNTTASITPCSDTAAIFNGNNISTISSSSSHPHHLIVDSASWASYQVPSNRSESQLETRSHDSIPRSSLSRTRNPRDREQLKVQFDSSTFEQNAQNNHNSGNHIVEAGEIVELLKMKTAYVSGGKDTRGSLIISVPISEAHKYLSVKDASLVFSYLIYNIRSTSLCSGYTVLIDGRGLETRILARILQAFEDLYEPNTTHVYVLKSDIFLDKSKLLELRRERIISAIQIQYINLSKLHRIIDPCQLTEEFSGTYSYSHNQWLQNTVDFEKFKKESNATLKDLDTSFSQLSDHEKRFSKSNADYLMDELQELYKCTMTLPSSTIESGQQLLRQLETDQDSGFRSTPENSQMNDSFMTQEKVKDLLKSVFHQKEKFEEVWRQSEHKLSQLVNFLDIEKGIKNVIEFVLGPAEKILNLQQEIGGSFHVVEDLKRQHERLELKCTETYGQYAELRHKAEQMHSQMPEDLIVADINIQKEYMDAVCRSFANRLERRRNILICSSRFHRLTEEVLQRSLCMENGSQTDSHVENASLAKITLQMLEEEHGALGSLREHAMQEGNRLLDNLMLPVKNALGKDITPDYSTQSGHAQKLLDDLEETIAHCNEIVEMRKMKLKQIVQIFTCEIDARQAVQWILDLCEVLVESHNQLGRNVTQVVDFEEEHRKFEDIAKGTYDYGRQLLETALILRKPCELSLAPQNEIVQHLFTAWRKFLQGTQERKTRLNVCKNFYTNSEKLLGELEQLNKELHSDLDSNGSQSVHCIMKKHRSTRDKVISKVVDVLRTGKTLLHKMKFPVIPSDESHKDYGDEAAAERIQEQISAIENIAEQIDNTIVEDEEPTSTCSEVTSTSYRSAEDAQPSSSGPDDWHSCQSNLTSVDEWKSAEEGVQSDSWYSADDCADRRSSSSEPKAKGEESKSTADQKESESMCEATRVDTEVTKISYSREWSNTSGQTTKISYERSHNDKAPGSFMSGQLSMHSDGRYKEASEGQVVVHIETTDNESDDDSNEKNESAMTINDFPIFKVNEDLLNRLELSKEWLELKIQDMQPEMTHVGASLPEAQELQKFHQIALDKLQTKQSPVEELLNQADQMISTQKPKAEVYSAMATTLGDAWKQLNVHLEYRKLLLEQSVIFQTRVKEFVSKMDGAEKDFVDQYLPEDIEICRKVLQLLHESKKGILDSSRHAMNEGYLLIEKIRQINVTAMGDARGQDYHKQRVYMACAAIERQLEELNDRRRELLDVIFIRRKKLLEECLQYCLINHDVDEVEKRLKSCDDEYVRNHSLGNSPANAEILQHEHRKMHSEVLKIQDRIVKLTHASEKLAQQSSLAKSDELLKKTFAILEKCSNLIDICDNREKLYVRSINFFRSAQSAISKLDQIEVQLQTSNAMKNTSSQVQLHSQMSQAIIDVTNEPINDGRSILSVAGSSGTEGIVQMINELENRRSMLDSVCTAHRSENLQRTLVIENVDERIHSLEVWLFDTLEAFLRSYQDMGSVVSMVKDFLDSHEKMLNDLQVREVDLDNASSILPSLVNCGDEGSRDIQYRLSSLHSKWKVYRSLLERRVVLADLYYKFHLLAVELSGKMDQFEDMLRSDLAIANIDYQKAEEYWSEVQHLYLKVSTEGKGFINECSKCEDKFLDTKRAILCVETLLDHFNSGKQSLLKLRAMFHSQSSSVIDSADTWEMFSRQVKVSQGCVEKAEQDMFPIITAELSTSQHIVDALEKRIETFLPTFQCIQSELEKQMKIAETLTVKTDLQSHKDKLIKTLADCDRRFQLMVTEYRFLVTLMITFFKNVNELENVIGKNEKSYNFNTLLQSVNELNTALQEHLANKQTILELFRFTQNEAAQLIQKINQVEPLNISHVDINKIEMILDSDKSNWESQWEQHKHRLEQDLQLCHFNEDLKQISSQIVELSKQLESMKGNYGNSVISAQNTSTAFVNFENTIEILENQITTFSSTAEKMLSNQHYDSSHIRFEINQLQSKWSKFHIQVSQYRTSINLSIEYFKLLGEAEEWLDEGSRILITVARKSTSVKTPEEANTLLEEIETFTKSGDVQQDERLKKLSKMAVQLFGKNSHVHVQPALEKTRKMKDSFVVINDELFSLAENLKDAEHQMMRAKKEQVESAIAPQSIAAEVAAAADVTEAQRSAQMVSSSSILSTEMYTSRSYSEIQSSSSSRALIPPYAMEPRPPEFTSLLGDANVLEGSKVKFECSVTGTPTPQVTWYKDGIIIENNPDYKTSFSNGLCTLSIEETFSEDSAKFICRAVNMVGMAETQGRLFVQEARPHEELAAPDFVKRLESAVVTVGQSFQFECQVTGHPLPLVVWTKDDVCIDNVPDYVITYNNGQCILRFEEIFKVDTATYSCKASNQAGQAVSTAKLLVQAEEMTEAPAFTTSLSNVMARAGQKIKLECTVTGRPKPQLTWLHNHKPIKESTKQMYYEGRRATLLITEAFPKDAGAYIIIAKNKAGEATSSCNVSVKGRLPMETSDSELASDLEPVKPRVVVPLNAISVIEGKKARLDCTIVGQPEPEVIWYHDGKPVKESNDFQLLFQGDQCSLIIREAYLEDAGLYRCSAINSAGEASSQCQLSVESLSEFSDFDKSCSSHKESPVMTEGAVPPKFIRVLNDTSAQVGRDLTLECSVTGQPDPACTWYKGDVRIEQSGDYQIARDKSGLLSLYISQVTADDEGVYTVKATNSAGDAKCYANVSIASEKKGPTVPPKPKIKAPGFTQLFSDQLVQKGKSITFECVVSGNPKPEVQWLFNEAPVKPWDYEISAAGDKHWLTIPVAGPRHNGRFELKAENDHGKAVCSGKLDVVDQSGNILSGDFKEETTESSVVTKKTVTQSTITKMGSSSDIPKSSSSTEMHKLKSARNYTYKKVGDQPPEESSTKEHIEEHELLPPEIEQARTLETTPLSMRKRPRAPVFKEPVSSAKVEEGKELHIFALIEGEPRPDVRWFKDDREVCRTPGINVSFQDNKAELTIMKVECKDSGCYKCTAENIAGNAASSADIQVTADSVIPAFKQPIEGVVISEGETAVFVAVITGKPMPSVTWFRNNVELSEENNNTSISFSRGRAMLRLVKTSESDSGCYKCTAYNSAGSASSTANLQVTPATAMFVQPTFTRPLSSISIEEGKLAVFAADLDAKPEPSVRWFKDGSEIRPDSGKITVETTLTGVRIKIPDTSVKDAGRYTCTVSNVAGTATTTGNLIVRGSVMPPQFVKRLAAMVVKSGDKVTMGVEVSGIPNPVVEWFKDDNSVTNSPDCKISSKGNKHSLIIPEAFPDDSGKYAVVAKNESGEAKSAAELIIEDDSVHADDAKFIQDNKEVGV